jgi:hypothetical protein
MKLIDIFKSLDALKNFELSLKPSNSDDRVLYRRIFSDHMEGKIENINDMAHDFISGILIYNLKNLSKELRISDIEDIYQNTHNSEEVCTYFDRGNLIYKEFNTPKILNIVKQFIIYWRSRDLLDRIIPKYDYILIYFDKISRNRKINNILPEIFQYIIDGNDLESFVKTQIIPLIPTLLKLKILDTWSFPVTNKLLNELKNNYVDALNSEYGRDRRFNGYEQFQKELQSGQYKFDGSGFTVDFTKFISSGINKLSEKTPKIIAAEYKYLTEQINNIARSKQFINSTPDWAMDNWIELTRFDGDVSISFVIRKHLSIALKTQFSKEYTEYLFGDTKKIRGTKLSRYIFNNIFEILGGIDIFIKLSLNIVLALLDKKDGNIIFDYSDKFLMIAEEFDAPISIDDNVTLFELFKKFIDSMSMDNKKKLAGLFEISKFGK